MRLSKKVCIHPMISQFLTNIFLGNHWISYERIHEFDPRVAHKSKKLLLICKDDFSLSFLCCVKFGTWLYIILGSFRSHLINLIFHSYCVKTSFFSFIFFENFILGVKFYFWFGAKIVFEFGQFLDEIWWLWWNWSSTSPLSIN